ncbi:MAG: hypothetical protein HC781_18155 [Leptolyngbyaceae cyanobacterium CSU_1_4]|nr:hypothetical protein [Leptolyngbyaceae cyanobacterium CSU_1_4]
MKRRQFFPLMVGGSTAFTVLGFIQNRPANATFLNDLLDGAIGSQSGAQSSPGSAAAPSTYAPSSNFAEIYGENYITREQFSVLQSGGATHWWDIAPKPYARMHSESGTEKYYFPFSFGDGGVIVVCDSSGAIASWDISTDNWVAPFSPADMSEYNYYPPKAVEVAVAPPIQPIQPTGYPPVPPNAPVSTCY